MSNVKSERLVNLLILLLSSRRFLTKHQIRETIDGYRGQSDGAFERMFERDKDELRALGVPLKTGSNDPFVDEDDGYRIERREFELPAMSFSTEELAVLGAAALVWQDSVAATHTAAALATLRAAGAEPEPHRLHTLAPRIPAEPAYDAAWAAIPERRVLRCESPGQPRRLLPWRLLQRSGRWCL
ncbi:MAG: DNA-binding transcriptional regulator, partial [Arachnia sp.]